MSLTFAVKQIIFFSGLLQDVVFIDFRTKKSLKYDIWPGVAVCVPSQNNTNPRYDRKLI